MNYFYSFFFLFLSILILIKPFVNVVIEKWVLESNHLKKVGLANLILGVACIYFGTQGEFWFERLWMVITFSLGILLVIRSLLIFLFPTAIKKFVTFIINNYYKVSIPLSLVMFYLSFFVLITDYIGPQKDISSCQSDQYVDLICGFKNPEDIVITPDEEYMFISEMGGVGPYVDIKSGYFALLNIELSLIHI